MVFESVEKKITSEKPNSDEKENANNIPLLDKPPD